MSFDVKFFLCWWMLFKITDAGFTWMHSDSSLNVLYDQTATFSCSVDVGSGHSWQRVEINRNHIKSTQGDEKLISLLLSANVTVHLQEKAADLHLVVKGTSNIVNITFTLQNARRADDMYYIIYVVRTRDYTNDVRFTKLNVLVAPDTPTIQTQNSGAVYCQSEHVNLTCEATVGNPVDTNFTFYRDNQAVKVKRGTVNGNKTMASAAIAVGLGVNSFTCKATNLAGSRGNSAKVDVEAKERPVISDCPNKAVVEGANLVWTCDATGIQPLTTSWFNGNNNISSRNILNVPSIKKTHAGMYRFTVRSGNGCTANTTVYLTVQYAPQLTYPQGSNCKIMTINEQQDIILVCNTDGEPTPTITWTKDGLPLSKQGSPLVLSSVKNSDAGNYSCTAANGIGKKDTACWKLDVHAQSKGSCVNTVTGTASSTSCMTLNVLATMMAGLILRLCHISV